MPVLGIEHSAPAFGMPAGACDCHVHVFGPAREFPFWTGRAYTPGEASVDELLALQAALRMDRVVVVHPSPYGTDNRCTLTALRRLGPRARGVAVIDPHSVTAQELDAMHRVGVRGVRVNLESAGQRDPDIARSLLTDAARCVAPLGWHVQTFAHPELIVALANTIRHLPVPLVIDHFGRVPAAAGPGQPAFVVLLELLQSDHAYVKLSAPHRISDLPDCADAANLARTLAQAAPGRVVWGSDWPHPKARRTRLKAADVIEPFDPIDDGLVLNRLAQWLPDQDLLRRILVDNPAHLYDY